jgi:hypothetical protein
VDFIPSRITRNHSEGCSGESAVSPRTADFTF